MQYSETLLDLLKGECWVAAEIHDRLGWPITEEMVQERLGLRISRRPLGAKIEALLSPPEKETGYNGQIIVNRLYEEDNTFDYMHEVVHYIYDVGIGNRVNREFARKRVDNHKDAKERYIDFLTAASLIPLSELLKDIEYYDKYWYKIHEGRYTRQLMDKYQCSKKCLMQRYSEVHTVRRALRQYLSTKVVATQSPRRMRRQENQLLSFANVAPCLRTVLTTLNS